ncbi:MAG: ATP-binding cassette domain-containing protein [Paracoccaceae bacterium]|jgi:ATP-binding cassette subfamily C protein CydC|nr:ATP-binding cassette domain-containing protein [Paracoccaceae bacterium]MDP7184458.1 ATP-binding cassette domain-containing protein [Paracoccaceae bacterium]
MTRLMKAIRLIWSAAPWAMSRGMILSVFVLLTGAALLGLSGWLITSTALAGLAGIALDLSRPNGIIRVLALGRAVSRYGERILTHDATLRALAVLRVDLLRRYARLPFDAMQRLRSGTALTRITADVEALDGLALRLVLPVLAALITHAAAYTALLVFVAPEIAATVAVGYFFGTTILLTRLGIISLSPSTRAEEAQQSLKRLSVDVLRGQTDLIMQGGMAEARGMLSQLDSEARAARAELDRLDRRVGAGLMILSTVIGGGVLLVGNQLVKTGQLDPALAALAFFVAVALEETVSPLRRGVAEIGRMYNAAGRVMQDGKAPARDAKTKISAKGRELSVEDLSFGREGAASPLFSNLSFTVSSGETVALTGPSGRGKSSLLNIAAALVAPTNGVVRLGGIDVQDWPEDELRLHQAFLPQRSALIAGTIRENLSLAREGVSDDDAWASLNAAGLRETIAERGGLDSRLGESGRGLSGGESRRLALARVLLRTPEVLLLDEPTEGLDDATARAVLAGIRTHLPQAAILTASHRSIETGWADRIIRL